MGDPKRPRKQYSTPIRPWDRARMEKESHLINHYGLRSKKEVWKTETILRDFRRKARRLMAASGDQAVKEAQQMIVKLQKLGLLEEGSTLVDVLNLDIENVLDRRLQSIVYDKGLARTPKQARQLVVHGHIMVGDRCVTIPSYLTSIEEEAKVDLHPSAPFEKIEREEETPITPEPVEVGEEE
ncbi:30S ribosomal protein S4 [candidate division MSBL1 archaeon SCGC-AAA261O19]|uniref:Small ribosomal subunit protein uS4 n=1 Tax=candidate division MSBL1 archaeon SCGC-AAA261O19 TaxID=1698277 RepID=A0A133VCW5_9EURY|nr:30S ribosomal protein S4 [candidate division MSBL1 archaeon SCGC-AAA261O19]